MTPRTDRSSGRGAWRVRTALIVGLAIWGLLALRLVLIQAVHAPRLAGLAERQHVARVRLAPDRGIIYDRNMRPLTDNLVVRSACAYPSEIESPRSVARDLARVLGGSYDHYLSKLSEEKSFVWIDRQLPPETATELAELGLPGVGFLKESKRVYPHGRRASQVLGLTDVDGRGIGGVESQMDEALTGSEAWVYHCLDSAGRRTPTPSCTKVVPRDGANVVLTLDLDLQSIVEVELERAVRENGAKSGMVVVQDPWTGEILAMASWPTFDPNCPSRYSTESQKNRPVTDQFEPGSTFKMITTCAALSTGSADLSSVYYAGRGSRLFGERKKFRIRDVHPYGWLDLRGALSHSSNVCFAQIGSEVGDVSLYTYARAFGFGCPTGIQLPGEVRGVLRSPSEWSGRSAHTVAIGQEVAVTALQLVSAYSVVANGGYLMEPRIIKAVLSEDGKVTSESRPKAVRRVIDAESAALLRGLLTAVTEDGSGRNACVTEFRVAGKTGTAQKTAPGTAGFAPGKFVSSFVGMVPADDPQLVCLIVIDEPEGRGLGGQVAAPSFSRIVERITRGPGRHYVARDERPGALFAVRGDAPGGSGMAVVSSLRDGALGFAYDTAAAMSSNRVAVAGGEAFERADGSSFAESGGPLMDFAGGRGVAGGRSVAGAPVAADGRGVAGGSVVAAGVWPSELPEFAEVPDLRGMSIRRARREASCLGLVLSFEGSGLVKTQSPRPGASVASGSKVIVRCSS
jgi:cell division protein FtsI (penicillin-binding protein 3)